MTLWTPEWPFLHDGWRLEDVPPTQDEIQRRRRAVLRFHVVGLWVPLVLVMGILLIGPLTTPTDGEMSAAQWLFLAVAATSIVFMALHIRLEVRHHPNGGDYDRISDRPGVLLEREYSELARYIAQTPRLRSYRDAVAEMGRELTVHEVIAMLGAMRREQERDALAALAGPAKATS